MKELLSEFWTVEFFKLLDNHLKNMRQSLDQ